MRMSLEYEKVLVGVSDTRCSQNCIQVFLHFFTVNDLDSDQVMLSPVSPFILACLYAHIGENASIQFFNLRSLSDNHI